MYTKTLDKRENIDVAMKILLLPTKCISTMIIMYVSMQTSSVIHLHPLFYLVLKLKSLLLLIDHPQFNQRIGYLSAFR